MYSKSDIIDAHDYSIHNRNHIEKSYYCGCFCCGRIFRPFQIRSYDWIDDNDTALCPYCGIDSVIGDYSGFPVTKDFFNEMKEYWF